MASSRKIVTLDVGWSTLKLAEFLVGKNGSVTLTRFGIEELNLDPNKEEDRPKAITPALASLIRRTGIRGTEFSVSVSGQSTFTKFIKLPNVDASQIEKMVVFEAQQNVPFPIEEVVWDYQMIIPRTGGTESECVIVAIKKDILEAELSAIEAVGVKVVHVDVAPFCLVNSFAYNLPDDGGCSMIINMGARSTNLIFMEGGKFWIRTFPIAGNQITQHICNELQEPFIAAETLKRGKGFVSLGGIYADPPDEMAARISKLIRATMTRLHIDVNRSISFWRTTFGGSAPKQVYLYGGASQIPYLNFFIQDKLNVPVEYFNPLSNVNLGAAVQREDLRTNFAYTAECLGLALRQCGSCPTEITLDSPRILERVKQRQTQLYYYVAVFMWALLMVAINIFLAKELAIEQATLSKETVTANTVKGLNKQLKPKVDEFARIQALAKSVQELGEDRQRWPSILNNLNDKIIRGIWIIDLTPKVADLPTPGNHQPGNQQKPPGTPNTPPGGPNTPGAPGAPGTLGTAREDIVYLELHGLYHDDDHTQHLKEQDLDNFVTTLRDLPDFAIPTDMAQVIPTIETREMSEDPLALSFPLKLQLKQPIRLRPGS